MSAQSPSPTILALDVMGGDNAPKAVLKGARMAWKEARHLRFRLFGDRTPIERYLTKHKSFASVCEIIHTDHIIAPDEKPSIALRQGRESSMRLAINDVAEGHSSGIVSAGNTGALMAISKFVFRTLPGVNRPAITAMVPTMKRDSVLLDMGANLECDAEQLFQFAVMGSAFYRAVKNYDRPTIGILNVGSEEAKGHEYLREAAELLRNSALADQFYGFVEGYDLAEGTVDVVVTDGFTGNIVLKSAEGVARFCTQEMRHALTSNPIARLGALLAKPGLLQMKRALNPSLRNGGMFVGLNGVAIKSHGSADPLGFANAIHVARHIVEHRLNETIIEELRRFGIGLDESASARPMPMATPAMEARQ